MFASTEAAQLFKVSKQCYGGHDHPPVDEHEINETYERTVPAEIIEEEREGVVAEMHEDRAGEAVALPDEGEQRPDEERCQKLHQIPVHEPEEQRTDDDREELPTVPELIIDEPAEQALLHEGRDDHGIQNHPEAGHPPTRDLRRILHREALLVQKRLHRSQQDRAEGLQPVDHHQQPEIRKRPETRMRRPRDSIAPEQEQHEHQPEQTHRDHREVLLLIDRRPILDQKTTAHLEQKLI